MKHYKIEEFLGNTTPNTLNDEVEKKINLLYDFRILTHTRDNPHDKRENFVKALLMSKNTIISMENTVHDIITGKLTLNELLRRNGYAIS